MASSLSTIALLYVDPRHVKVTVQPYNPSEQSPTTHITVVQIGDNGEIRLHVVGDTDVEQLGNVIALGHNITRLAEAKLAALTVATTDTTDTTETVETVAS